MSFSVRSLALVGLDARPVVVTASHTHGTAKAFDVRGVSDAAAREHHVRVRCALAKQMRVDVETRILVTIEPAVPHGSATLDLSIAIAVLGLLEQLGVAEPLLTATLFVGELSLEGTLRGGRGVFPTVLQAKQHDFERVIVPEANGVEAAETGESDVFVALSLLDVVEHLKGTSQLRRAGVGFQRTTPPGSAGGVDYSKDPSVRAVLEANPAARRALEIAAAGGHALLFLGAGRGALSLARWLCHVLPPMTASERAAVLSIQSVAGVLSERSLTQRPFRAPHHTVSAVGLIGGGAGAVRPGEVSIAHAGVLYLDQLQEFRRTVLESLRPAMEGGSISLGYDKTRCTYPARALVIAEANACPCDVGPLRTCTCTPERFASYRARMQAIATPFDLRVQLVGPSAVTGEGEPIEAMQARIVRARRIQGERFGRGETIAPRNAQTEPRDGGCKLSVEATRLVYGGITMTSPQRTSILRVARTIADLSAEDVVQVAHVEEAIALRGTISGEEFAPAPEAAS